MGREFARALAGAPYIIRKAAYEAGLVESNLRNLNYGDADSLGALQERTSIYGRSHALDPFKTAQRFRREAQGILGKGFKGSAGDLAAAVQRPAAQFRGRYAQRSGEAAALVKAFAGGGGGGSGAAPDAASAGDPGASPAPGLPQGSDGTLALLQALQGQQSAPSSSGALPTPATLAGPPLPQGYQAPASSSAPAPKLDIGPLLAAVGEGQTVDMAQPDVATDGGSASGAGGSADTGGKGVASFDGKKVAAWIEPALEYARAHGWKGSVNSGYRSEAEQARIYNSGVRPAAKPGTSNHEFTGYPGGAVDVSEAAQLAAILERSPWRKKLVWAGSKDPVHFSHPHGGSY